MLIPLFGSISVLKEQGNRQVCKYTNLILPRIIGAWSFVFHVVVWLTTTVTYFHDWWKQKWFKKIYWFMHGYFYTLFKIRKIRKDNFKIISDESCLKGVVLWASGSCSGNFIYSCITRMIIGHHVILNFPCGGNAWLATAFSGKISCLGGCILKRVVFNETPPLIIFLPFYCWHSLIHSFTRCLIQYITLIKPFIVNVTRPDVTLILKKHLQLIFGN